jgi:hypothetical protein
MNAEATRQGIISMLMGMDDEIQLAEIAEFLGRNPFSTFRGRVGGVKTKICYVDAAGVRYERVLDLRQLSDDEMEIAMELESSEYTGVTGDTFVRGPNGFEIKDHNDLTEVDAS